ncbi:MAG: glycosyltransferase family 2 protein [Planctomycetes bacterium]|nr:glycosyltransferase family 2 protein [Planctomycetota bacterium]
MKECFLSIVIPAYNEEERILPSLRSICAYLSRQDYSSEVIVVDDGSVDNTVKKINEFLNSNEGIILIKNNKNKGKGYSVKRGMLAAKGQYVFFTDADLSTPIEEVDKCLPYLNAKGYDVIIGSRSIPGADIIIHQPWYREKMGKIFNFIIRLVLMGGLIDTQCGFKGFKRDVARKVFDKCRIAGFAFDVEVLYLSKKFGFKIKELPIRWRNSILSKVSPVRHSLQMFKDLIVIKINDIKGYYG